MTSRFIHLRVHSEYSIVDGIVRIPTLLEKVVADAMPAVALTDQTNLFALVKFYRSALARGVKPIIGADFYVRHAKQRENSRLTLLCMNNVGYRNITELITKAYTHGQQSGLACVDQEWVTEHAEGLIAISGGLAGELGQLLLKDKQELAETYLNDCAKVFKDRFYIELQRTGRDNEETYNQRAIALAKAHNMPVVATNDVRFISTEEFDAHEVRVCINQSRVLSDPRRTHAYSEQQYLRSTAEMLQLFSDVPSALQNTVEIAKRCNVTLEFGNNVLPEFPIPDAVSTDEYLRQQSDIGLQKRLDAGGIATEMLPLSDYHKRLEIELDVIQRMGYAGYFLIVSDFTRWARENDVPVGPGRGSGAGSLVAYVLGITDIDPLRYDLLFERFLNPERVSMPDFDIDFCMAGRDRVIDYVAQRYGREKVSQIITYGTMAAKAVVRDVGRVLGHSYGFVDRIAKMVPFEIGMTLKKALSQEKDFQALYDEEEDVRGLIDMALQLEGIARNAGKHAGGVVIAPSKLTDFTPLYCEASGANIVTQLDKDDVEAIGLVKFDFLGLRTLTIIDGTVKSVNRRRKKENAEPLELNQIPLDDDASYQLLQDQQTTAVFQLESSGIKDILGRLKPDKFDDVVAMVALYRPGPLQSGMVDDFIDRKHGAAIEYPHPDLEPILNQTYGVILYQEQVMQIAQVLAGYTLGGADLLRRAMGKKKASEMAKQRSVFVEGSTKRGVDKDQANFIFDLMEKFAGYGFNKSHSVAYALLAYQTAWLKAHYPAEFMASVLSADMDNTDKVVNLIDECRSMGLEVMPPDLNSSYYAFTVTEEHQVVYGLGAIKGVGEAAVESLVQERASGPYKTLGDLCIRLDLQKFNRRSLEAMIRSGAADVFMQNRATLMHALPKAVQLADQQQKNNDTGQNDLFGGGQVMAKEALLEQKPEWDMDAKLAAERETLGLYLTGHPVDQYRQELNSLVGKNLSQRLAMPVPEVDYRNRNKNTIKVAGLLMHMRLRNSPSGRIAFLTIDDNTARLDIAVFTDAYSRFKHLLVKDRILIIEGSLSIDEFNSQPRLRANEIVALEEVRVEKARSLIIEVDGSVTAQQKSALAKDLMATLQQYCGGQCHMEIHYQTLTEQGNLRLGEQWKVIPEQELLRRLYNLEGVSAIKVRY